MPYDPERHHRRSIWLATFDYTRIAAYFVTLCTLSRECLFGSVVGADAIRPLDGVRPPDAIRPAVMRLSAAGEVARDEWLRSAEVRSELTLDAFVVMPNHVHGIVLVTHDGAGSASATADRAPATADRAPATRAHAMRPYNTGAGANGPHADPARRAGAIRPYNADDDESVGAHGMRPPPPADRAPAAHPAQSHTLVRPARSLGAFVAGYKGAVTRALTQMRVVSGASVWQRNYYEHVIRNDDDLDRIRRYIANNPAQWDLDRENPANQP